MVRVLVTGAGAPGFYGTYQSLKNNYDNREIEIIGTDARDDVYGKLFCKVHKVPNGNEKGYLEIITKICEHEKIDVVLPQCTNEIYPLSQSGLRVAAPHGLANDKGLVYRMAEANGIPIPKFIEMQGKIVIKPTIGHGSEGIHYIDGESSLISEFIEGDEYTVDCFRKPDTYHNPGEIFIAIPRKRNEIRKGISWITTIEKNEELIEYSRRLADGLKLKYAFGFQFKGGKLLECNPRVQGTMVASTLAGANLIYSAVKMALKEPIPEFNINWNKKIYRYTVCESV